MSKKDFSIEYAHIYTNDKIGEEHKLSLEILNEIKKEKNLTNRTSSLVVMVDDYSFPDLTFDYQSFIQWLSEEGHAPDLILKESQLIPICDKVLTSIENESLQEEISSYISTKKYPCSLFIAAWYLARLGYISTSLVPQNFIAQRLINILPESFKSFEEKGLEIIRSTKYKEAVGQIEYKFIPGRKLD
ncbi:MAG: hypothetical protein HYT69_01340 [Candidatus Zambryskibacteria bacterium]|nr:hypothetical protein [Candidatus Zambryskibacteria bacterium]